MARLPTGSSAKPRVGTLRLMLAAVALAAVLTAALAACSSTPQPSARDKRWQQAAAYLAQHLPAVRAAGLGPVSSPTWHAAATRLEKAVPTLTDGQIRVWMAQLVALLHDDETLVEFPSGPVFGLDAQQVGSGLYLLAVPETDRALVGARLLAIDGHPIAQVNWPAPAPPSAPRTPSCAPTSRPAPWTTLPCSRRSASRRQRQRRP